MTQATASASATAAANNRDGHALEALRIGTIAVCCWTANPHLMARQFANIKTAAPPRRAEC
ncbi:MAG: hypothetical protein WAN86_06775 [Hyphomicrobiaceae bacterium]